MIIPSFPQLPGVDIVVKRSEVFSTVVQVAASGNELRASFWSLPRYRYELTFNYLRQAGFSQNTFADELVALQSFFEAMLGQWGTFNFLDPVSGIPRLCRFEQDNMDLERIVQKAWKCDSLKLITVKR